MKYFAIPLLILSTSVCHAIPNIAVNQDHLCLKSSLKLPLIEGGNLTQQTTYSGPLLNFDRDANSRLTAKDGSSPSDEVVTYANSTADISSFGFDLFTIAEFYFPGSPSTPSQQTWNPNQDPKHVAKGALQWRFRSDSNTTAYMIFQVRGIQGFVQAKLVDITTNNIVVDYQESNYVEHHKVGDFKIYANHIYTLTARLSESHHQDDDESAISFYFNEPVNWLRATRKVGGC
ncbi:hypothetical protein NBRC116494_23940 [Aurantivibrio plasticivorans]